MNYTLRRNAPDSPNRVSDGGLPVAAFKRPCGSPHRGMGSCDRLCLSITGSSSGEGPRAQALRKRLFPSLVAWLFGLLVAFLFRPQPRHRPALPPTRL